MHEVGSHIRHDWRAWLNAVGNEDLLKCFEEHQGFVERTASDSLIVAVIECPVPHSFRDLRIAAPRRFNASGSKDSAIEAPTGSRAPVVNRATGAPEHGAAPVLIGKKHEVSLLPAFEGNKGITREQGKDLNF